MAKSFDENLKSFVAANTNAAKLAVVCSTQAIEHLYETGDIVFCQRFLDAMTKNWNRSSAFKLWLRDFAPVGMEQGKLTYVKERAVALWPNPEAKETLLKMALAKPFYEYAPEKEIVSFTFDNVVDYLWKGLQGFKNGSKYSLESIEANKVRIEQAERMLTMLKAGTIATILPATPTVDTVETEVAA